MKNQVSTNSQTKDLWSFLVIQPLRYSDQIYWLSLTHWIRNDILPITKKFTCQKITHWQLHVPCNVCELPPFLCSIMKQLFFINTNVYKNPPKNSHTEEVEISSCMQYIMRWKQKLRGHCTDFLYASGGEMSLFFSSGLIFLENKHFYQIN